MPRSAGARSGHPALTPTEIDVAWSSGPTYVKVFPANVFGPAYLRDVAAPLPDVPLVPTGGVTPENLHGYAEALVAASIVDTEDWGGLRERAVAIDRAVADAPWRAR